MSLESGVPAYLTIIDLLRDRASNSYREISADATHAISLLCHVDTLTMKGYNCWRNSSGSSYIIQDMLYRFVAPSGHFVLDYSEILGEFDKTQIAQLPFGLSERSYSILRSFTQVRQIELQDGLAWAIAYTILEEEGELLMKKGRKVRRITFPPLF